MLNLREVAAARQLGGEKGWGDQRMRGGVTFWGVSFSVSVSDPLLTTLIYLMVKTFG